MATLAYAIAPRALFVRDTPERIDFHVENGDYFAMLATIMGFMQEGLERCAEGSKEHQLAKDLRQDLRYMHAKYQIVPKGKD